MNATASESDARKANLAAWARVLWRALTATEPRQLRVLNRRELLPVSFPKLNLVVSPPDRWAPLAVLWVAALRDEVQPSIRLRAALERLLGSELDVTDVDADLPDALDAPWVVLMAGDAGSLALTAPVTSLDQLLAPEPQSGELWIPTTLPDPIEQALVTRVMSPAPAIFAGPLGLWRGHFSPDVHGGTFLPEHRVDDVPVHRLRFAAALQGFTGGASRRCLPDSQGVSEGYANILQAGWLKSANDVWALRVEPPAR